MIKISKIISILFILILIRFVFVFDILKANLDIIFRPGTKILTVSLFSKYLLIIFGVMSFFYFIKKLKKTESQIKDGFFYLFFFYYILSSLSQRCVFNRFSYLYVLQTFNVKFSDLIPFFEQDLFFESPYIFWFALVISLIFYFLKKKNCQELAIPLWIIAFLFLDFPLSTILITNIIASIIIAILGFKYFDKNSSIYYHLLQFIIYLTIMVYGFYTSVYDDKQTLLYCVEITLLYYIPSFIMLFVCVRSKEENAIALTWVLPAITTSLLTMPITKIELYQCISVASATVNSFLFVGNLFIMVGFILALTFLFGKINEKIKNITFYLLSALGIIYYIFDFLLYHYSHFRINIETINWTMTMNNAFETTLKTCLNYIDNKTWFLIIFITILIVLCVIKSDKIFKKQSSLGNLCLMILLSGQISSTILPIISVVTFEELQEPFFILLKDIKLVQEKKNLTDSEIKTGLKECGIILKEYNDINPINGNNYNLILVTLESVHWRYLDIFCEENEKTWPEMSKFKDRMEVFPYFFSVFPESTTADVAVVTGLQPYASEYILNKSCLTSPSIVNEIKKADYETYLFTSGSVRDGNLISLVKTMPFDNSLTYTTKISNLPDDYWYWGIKEEKNVDNILNALSSRKNNKPYFVWYRSVYPHSPFPVFDDYKNLRFKKENFLFKDKVTDYKNCLVYLDRQLAKLVKGIDILDKKTNKKTFIIFVADHGEMLEEKDNFGLLGHGLYCQSKLTNCPCIVIHPESKGLIINKKFGSQIDVVPTILDYLKIKSSVKRYEFGESLINNLEHNRPIYLASSKSYALVEDGYYYYFIDKKSPKCSIEEVGLDQNFKATFNKINTYDEEKILEKYDRINKYFKLQEEFLSRY